MTVSEIVVWRRYRRLAWKPWTAQFEDDRGVYAAEAWTARGARRQLEAFRNALLAASG